MTIFLRCEKTNNTDFWFTHIQKKKKQVGSKLYRIYYFSHQRKACSGPQLVGLPKIQNNSLFYWQYE